MRFISLVVKETPFLFMAYFRNCIHYLMIFRRFADRASLYIYLSN